LSSPWTFIIVEILFDGYLVLMHGLRSLTELAVTNLTANTYATPPDTPEIPIVAGDNQSDKVEQVPTFPTAANRKAALHAEGERSAGRTESGSDVCI
jgi:hypothetical protein